MKHLKKFENVDFDDWGTEEQQPINPNEEIAMVSHLKSNYAYKKYNISGRKFIFVLIDIKSTPKLGDIVCGQLYGDGDLFIYKLERNLPGRRDHNCYKVIREIDLNNENDSKKLDEYFEPKSKAEQIKDMKRFW